MSDGVPMDRTGSGRVDGPWDWRFPTGGRDECGLPARGFWF